jgi:hypothetical protein
MMKQKTDIKNKTNNSELPDDNNIIDLIEEVDNRQDSAEIKGSKYEKSDVANNDDELILLKEEIQVSPEQNEDIIELTDEVSMTFQEESAKTTEIIDASVERVIRKIFAEKIDFMIREAIKKVLAEDIEKLQKQILRHHEEKA